MQCVSLTGPLPVSPCDHTRYQSQTKDNHPACPAQSDHRRTAAAGWLGNLCPAWECGVKAMPRWDGSQARTLVRGETPGATAQQAQVQDTHWGSVSISVSVSVDVNSSASSNQSSSRVGICTKSGLAGTHGYQCAAAAAAAEAEASPRPCQGTSRMRTLLVSMWMRSCSKPMNTAHDAASQLLGASRHG